jgi:hypothetical protein
MYCSLLSLLALSAALQGPGTPPGKGPTYPQPGSDIPGPFTVYNVTGPFKGEYHCPVCEHGLDPVVMIVVKGTELADEKAQKNLDYLITKLDNAVQKNTNIRLASFVVFLSDQLQDLARDDDVREDLARKLTDRFPSVAKTDVARDAVKAKLKEGQLANLDVTAVENALREINREKHVTLALDKQGKLPRYQIGDKTDVFILLYNKYRVVSVHQLSKEQLTEEKAKEILGEVAEKLGAKRS